MPATTSFFFHCSLESNEVSATFSTGDVEAAVSLASEQLEAAQRGSDLMQAPIFGFFRSFRLKKVSFFFEKKGSFKNCVLFLYINYYINVCFFLKLLNP